MKTEGNGQADQAQTAPRTFDPDLARIVDAWPTLPGDIKAAILAIAKANRSL